LQPLLDAQTFTLNANDDGETLDLWCADAQGAVTLQAKAEWV
jgi:hydroxyacyl-ACP dehydratase HTD2-like protein with hotdog domain